MLDMRATGTALVPGVPWGSHFCQFYQTRDDLLDQVVPYLKAGLEGHEACVWVTSEPMDPQGARAALGAVVPDLAAREAHGQMHIAPYSEWYLRDGVFDPQRVLDSWLAFLTAALDRGFSGLRVTGNTAWLEKSGWTDFAAYEAAISGAIAGRPVLVLCTYQLDRCNANEILDVVKNHDFALVKRRDAWEVIESHGRRVLRNALEETQARYRALFDEAMAGIGLHEIVTGVNGEPIDYLFLDVNPAFERMTGLAASDVIGRRVTDVIPGIEKGGFISTYGRVALTGEACRFEAFAEPLGRHYDISAFPLGRGQFATIFRDITEEKQSAAERDRLFREAQDANRLKDEFLATLSHELRTPLTAILGWSMMLRDGSLDSGKRRLAVEAIVRNAEAQAGLVNDVLDVSRIVTGKMCLTVTDVDLVVLLDEAMAAVKPAADAKGVRLERRASAADVRAVGDANRLRQVIWNLLSNAVKFTPAGGSVRAEVGRAGSQIEVRVIDTGAGIAPEFLPRVFDRFTQADGSASRRHGGLGLGLAIVRHLVELHGGEVAADSAGEGCGATFSVRLPVRAVAVADAPDTTPSGSAPPVDSRVQDLTGLRVLVVDDDADALELVSLVLSASGAGVMTATSAETALQVLDGGEHVDVIVSDIGMPRLDGYEMMRRLRARPAHAATVAIALTAYGRPDDRARALASGYQHYIAKPVSPSLLVAAVWEASQTARGSAL